MVQILGTRLCSIALSDSHHATHILGDARVQHSKAENHVRGMCLSEHQRRVGALKCRSLAA